MSMFVVIMFFLFVVIVSVIMGRVFVLVGMSSVTFVIIVFVIMAVILGAFLKVCCINIRCEKWKIGMSCRRDRHQFTHLFPVMFMRVMIFFVFMILMSVICSAFLCHDMCCIIKWM